MPHRDPRPVLHRGRLLGDHAGHHGLGGAAVRHAPVVRAHPAGRPEGGGEDLERPGGLHRQRPQRPAARGLRGAVQGGLPGGGGHRQGRLRGGDDREPQEGPGVRGDVLVQATGRRKGFRSGFRIRMGLTRRGFRRGSPRPSWRIPTPGRTRRGRGRRPRGGGRRSCTWPWTSPRGTCRSRPR